MASFKTFDVTSEGILVNPKGTEVEGQERAGRNDARQAAHALTEYLYSKNDKVEVGLIIYDTSRPAKSVKELGVGVVCKDYTGSEVDAPRDDAWHKVHSLNGFLYTYPYPIKPTYFSKRTGRQEVSNRNINQVVKATYTNKIVKGEKFLIAAEDLAEEFYTKFLATITVDPSDEPGRKLAWENYQKEIQIARDNRILNSAPDVEDLNPETHTVLWNGKATPLTEIPLPGTFTVVTAGDPSDIHFHGKEFRKGDLDLLAKMNRFNWELIS